MVSRLVGPALVVSVPVSCVGTASGVAMSSVNSKTLIASATLLVARCDVSFSFCRYHHIVHCRHSPNVSLKISSTSVFGLHIVVMSIPTSMGCSLFPSSKSPISNVDNTPLPTHSGPMWNIATTVPSTNPRALIVRPPLPHLHDGVPFALFLIFCSL